MLKDTYSFDDLKFSSPLVRDLINEKSTIQKYINRFFDLDVITEQIKEKKFKTEQRNVLATAVSAQAGDIKLSDLSSANIASLRNENTFTITTGHQLNLLSGPLYSIYKIGQVISICQTLSKKYPNQNFVPVFWMATEDHDFEEINHINLFGDKIAWEKAAQKDVIAGRIELKDIEGVIETIKDKFQNPAIQEGLAAFLDTYLSSKNMAQATRKLVNFLFAHQGIVIIDGDDLALKEAFKPIAIQEVKQLQVESTVESTNKLLEADGYHAQVFVRECNLFYIQPDGVRKRLKHENEHFLIGDKNYSRSEIINLINEEPQNFSPNALMRPLYQEAILPNLAYIGGGGEIAYWLQLKSTFAAFDIPFPMLRVRDSILLTRANEVELLNELQLELLDLKIGVDHIVKDMAAEKAEEELDLSEIKTTLANLEKTLIGKADQIQKGMDTMIAAEFAKFSNAIAKIESKMLKAEKGKYEKTQKQIQKIAIRYFPNGGFQERYETILPYYLADPGIVDKLIAKLQAEKTPVIRLIQL